MPVAKLSDLSLRRTQLMGVAALMILVCHASASHVLMPHWLSKLMDLGNYGVDIFLLLSGLGLYYSLDKNPITSIWGGVIYLKRRCYRILIPYWIVYVPYCIVFLLLGIYSFGKSLLCLSAMEYWLFHRGAWFVSLILILYLLAPALYRLISEKNSWAWTIVLISVITVLCKINVGIPDRYNVLFNIQFAFSRVPSFVLGMVAGRACKENKTITVIWLVALAIAGLALAKVLRLGYLTAWMIIPLVVYVINVILEWAQESWIKESMTFLGKISLESYLTNIALGSMLSTLVPAYISSPLFYGKYLQYAIVIVVGLLLAWVISRISAKWTGKLLNAS